MAAVTKTTPLAISIRKSALRRAKDLTAARKSKDRLNAADVVVIPTTVRAKDIRAAGALRIDTRDGPVEAVPISHDRLRELEELAKDARDFESVRATAGEETFPLEVAERLAAGDNPVRVFRDHRGLKAIDLAAAAGISPNYLSEIENGKKPGSVNVLRKIADVLDVDLDNLA